MAEYIELEPLRDEILNDTDPAYDSDTINHFLNIVDSQPTADVVEVVRCCDCEHKQENPDINNTCYLTCNLKYGLQGTIDPTDFCCYGERKEGAKE